MMSLAPFRDLTMKRPGLVSTATSIVTKSVLEACRPRAPSACVVGLLFCDQRGNREDTMSTAFRLEMDSAQEIRPRPARRRDWGRLSLTALRSQPAIILPSRGSISAKCWAPRDQTPDPNDDVHGIHVHNADRGVNGGIVFGQREPTQDTDDFAIAANPDGSTTFSGIWETTDPANSSINNFAATLGAATLGSDAALYWNIHTESFPAARSAASGSALPRTIAKPSTGPTATTSFRGSAATTP